jgi:PUA-domain protein
VKRRPIKEREAKKLIAEFLERTRMSSLALPLNPPIELVQANGEEILYISKLPIFAKSRNRFFPTLSSGSLLSSFPRATVNMGAVPHVCNGADIMAPGIVDFGGPFQQGDIVLISDERHHKPIAVAIALYDKAEAMKLKHGKVFRNIHYVGDQLWSAIKQIG